MARTPSPAAARIGSRIAELRKGQSLSVDGLAYKAGIDRSNIRAHEAGRAMMNVRPWCASTRPSASMPERYSKASSHPPSSRMLEVIRTNGRT